MDNRKKQLDDQLLGGLGDENAQQSVALNLANRLGMHIIQKSMRATREALEKEKEQLESIQIDLGVNMMSGNVLREKVNYEFNTSKEFQKTIELLAGMRPEHRSEKLCGSLLKIVEEI